MLTYAVWQLSDPAKCWIVLEICGPSNMSAEYKIKHPEPAHQAFTHPMTVRSLCAIIWECARLSSGLWHIGSDAPPRDAPASFQASSWSARREARWGKSGVSRHWREERRRCLQPCVCRGRDAAALLRSPPGHQAPPLSLQSTQGQTREEAAVVPHIWGYPKFERKAAARQA